MTRAGDAMNGRAAPLPTSAGRRRAAGLLAAAVLLWTVPVRGQPPPPRRDPLLDALAGRWRLTRSIRGTEVDNSVQADWVLGDQFLRLHMRDVAVPPRYEAIVMLGWQPRQQRYVAFWTDTFGPAGAAVGYATRDGDRLPFVFDYPDGPFFNTFEWNERDSTWTFRLESAAKDGTRQLFAIDRLRR
jgi:hypothetical protein